MHVVNMNICIFFEMCIRIFWWTLHCLNSSLVNAYSCDLSFFSLLPEKLGISEDSEWEGTRDFMVNVIEPQFNLHSEDANVSQ